MASILNEIVCAYSDLSSRRDVRWSSRGRFSILDFSADLVDSKLDFFLIFQPIWSTRNLIFSWFFSWSGRLETWFFLDFLADLVEMSECGRLGILDFFLIFSWFFFDFFLIFSWFFHSWFFLDFFLIFSVTKNQGRFLARFRSILVPVRRHRAKVQLELRFLFGVVSPSVSAFCERYRCHVGGTEILVWCSVT